MLHPQPTAARLLGCSGDWDKEDAKEDAFLRWVQVCNHPMALAIGTPCKFESQHVEVGETPQAREEEVCVGGEGGSVKGGFSALCLPRGSARPTPGRPRTSCSHSPPLHPELRSGHNSPAAWILKGPERLSLSYPLVTDREATNIERALSRSVSVQI